MVTWHNLDSQTEADQARFLLDQATKAYDVDPEPADITRQVRDYIALGYQVLDGQLDLYPQLSRFVQDVEEERDFNSFYNQIVGDDQIVDPGTAETALEIASYACLFVVRITAEGHDLAMPPPAEESMPYLFDHYRERAQALGIA